MLLILTLLAGPVLAADYYVNDLSTTGDVYTTAAGDDANDGLSPGAPKLTLTNLLAAYDLEPGDTVFMDTGIYSNFVAVIGTNDAGSTGGYVTVRGSTNSGAGGTVLLNTSAVFAVFVIQSTASQASDGARNVRLQDLTIRGGRRGVYAVGAPYTELIRVACLEQTEYGIQFGGAGQWGCPNSRIVNCTVYNNAVGAFVFATGNVMFENTILWAYARAIDTVINPPDYVYATNCVMRVAGVGKSWNECAITDMVLGDYNLFYLQGRAFVSPNAPHLYDLQKARGVELHSVVADPQFANPAEFDFHPRSQYGRFHSNGSIVTDTVTSVLIDLGYPRSAFTNETMPNGSRINVGAFGNTAQASRSPTNARLTALTLNDSGSVTGSVALYWAAVNFATGETVRVEYSSDGGALWTNIAVNVSATNQQVVWDTTGYESSARGLWRVVSESNTGIFDAVDAFFSVHNSNLIFYVNDHSTNGDVFCSAPGSPTNTGTTPASPLSSVQEIFNRYDVNGGDTIFVDTGLYILTNTLWISAQDGGDALNLLTVQGSTNYAGGGTVLSLSAAGVSAVLIQDTRGIRLADLTILGGTRGVYGNIVSDIELTRLNIRSNTVSGIQLAGAGYGHGHATDVLVQNCVVVGPSATGAYAIDARQSGPRVTVRNCTLWGNNGAYLGTVSSISNSIIRAWGPFGTCIIAPSSDYNVFWPLAGATISPGYAKLSDYQKASGRDARSSVFDPVFADGAGGDFHLQSQFGRWTPSGFTNDAQTSGAIDFGDPAAAFGNELAPNGGRLNAGAYGNTDQASKSRTNAWLLALTFNDGGTFGSNEVVRWNAYNFPSGATVRIETSCNGGTNWSVAVSGIAATSGAYNLNSVYFGCSSFNARWRVVSESDTNVNDATDTSFTVNRAPTQFYVNDLSTTGDVYTTAVGNNAHDGLSPGAPKLTVSSVLSTYTLAPGDIVYIDTGYYSNETVTITTSGSPGNPITFQGSTNYLAGGSWFVRNSTVADGFFISGAQHIRLADLRIRNARMGVRVHAQNALIERVYSISNSTGFQITDNNNTFRRCVAAYNDQGVNNAGNNVVCENGVFWQNTLHLVAGLGAFRNSVFVGGTLFGYTLSPPDSDFNVLWNVAMDFNPTFGTRYYANLWEAQNAINGWFNSIVAEPRFANPGNLDFHELSPVGRYNPAVTNFVTTDSVFSVTIDFGDPSFGAWTNEPSPNGGRINAGIYGGTSEASKSRTNAWLLAITFNDGGTLTQSGRLYWTSGNLTNTSTVRLEYSPDFGSNWLVIATNVPITNAFFAWNASAVTSTPTAYWRVMSELDTNVFDANDNYFVIRGPTNRFIYYVNDGSANGDVYCTATGSVANTGLSPSSPKATLQQILDAYDLGPNDVVYVDTGLYLTNTTTIGFADQGVSGAPVTIQGSTNYAAGGTIFDRQNAGADVIVMNNVEFINLSDLRVQNGHRGIYMTPASANLVFNRVTAVNNWIGFNGNDQTMPVVFTRCAAVGNSSCGLLGSGGGNWRWENGVSWSNGTAIFISNVGAPLTVANSIIVGGVAFGGSGWITGDYNIFWNNTLIEPGHSTLSSFQKARGGWFNCIVADPMLADPGALDFHEKSVVGRFLPGGSLTTDTVHSVAIDFGNPALTAYTNEVAPNGSRINAGLFGGTAEASLSRTNAWLLALTFNDGGTLIVPDDRVCWNASSLLSNSTVRIELSLDGGSTWGVAASNLPAMQGCYQWVNADFNVGTNARWRVVSESNTNVSDQNDAPFTYLNDFTFYYVNDAGTFGDVYTTAPGNDSNSGLLRSTPKASLQAVLDAYDLKRGDRIYVDTGIYRLVSDIVVTNQDSGNATMPVLIQGSTNEVWPTAFIGGGIVLNNVTDVSIRHLNIQGAARGVQATQATNILIEWVQAHANTDAGFHVNGGGPLRLRHSVALRNATNGLWLANATNVVVEHVALWDHAGAGLRLDGGAMTFRNSAIGALVANAAAYWLNGGVLFADYNSIYTRNGALVGTNVITSTGYATLSAWTSGTGQDTNSVGADPLFADPGAGDFHLMTTNSLGRYLRGYGRTNDSVTSPLINAGDPAAPCNNEPEPNGNRVDIGPFGNTAEATLSSPE